MLTDTHVMSFSQVRESLQNNFMVNKPDHLSLKTDIVTFAKDKWFLLFSRFYDAPKVCSPRLMRLAWLD